MTVNIVKAECKLVKIGSLEFDGIRIIDTGEYRMTQKQMLSAIGLKDWYLSRLATKYTTKSAKLTSKGFTWVDILCKYYNKTQHRRAKTFSLEDVRIFWRFQDKGGNEKAELIIDALAADSLRDRYDQVYKVKASIEERQTHDIRVLNKIEPWKALYSREFCDRATAWFGVGFYWSYMYCWMTDAEKCHLNKLRDNHKAEYGVEPRIHQALSEDIRERLKYEAHLLCGFLKSSTSKAHFKTLYSNCYGHGLQLELDLE